MRILTIAMILIGSVTGVVPALAASPTAIAQRPPAKQPRAAIKGQRIFFCGHSFHFHLPAELEDVVKRGGILDQEIVGQSMIGGSKSLTHWQVRDEDNQAKAALVAGEVDVLTLTPIYLPDAGIEKFAQLGFQHNPNFRIALQEFWLPFDRYEPHYYDPPLIPAPEYVNHNALSLPVLKKMHAFYYKQMDQQVLDINEKLGKQVVCVVPVGQAVMALREKLVAGKVPGLRLQSQLFTDALGHPAAPLRALITYGYFSVIYRKSPVGLPVPRDLVTAGIPTQFIVPLNRMLQEIAWDAVKHHPLSGLKKHSSSPVEEEVKPGTAIEAVERETE